jgi:hypothetical protein
MNAHFICKELRIKQLFAYEMGRCSRQLSKSTRPASGCSRNRVTRKNDAGTKKMLRKVVGVQCDDKVGFTDFGACAERFIVRIRRDVAASGIGNLFRLGSNQIESRADVMGANAKARKDLLVFVHDRFVNQPEKGVLLNPVPQKLGARHRRLCARLAEGRDSRHKH